MFLIVFTCNRVLKVFLYSYMYMLYSCIHVFMLYFTSVVVQSGPMKVTNHTTGEEALLKFHAYSYFSRERQKKVQHVYCTYTCTLYIHMYMYAKLHVLYLALPR